MRSRNQGTAVVPGDHLYGVYPACVTDTKDPEGQGRVKVMLPWLPDIGGERYEVWARLATFMGGKNHGSWFTPDPNDEVLVAFEAGDPRRPYVIGGLWSDSSNPPESKDDSDKIDRKVLCSSDTNRTRRTRRT